MPIYVEHWAGQFAILPQFCPIFNIGGMKLDHYFFHVSKSSEDQKKRSSPKLEEFLSPKSSEIQKKVQRSSSAQMQTIVKLLAGMQSYYWGDISPRPPGLRHPWLYAKMLKAKIEKTRLFCHIFIIGSILIGRGRPPGPPLSPGYAYTVNSNDTRFKIKT